jgi:hypothetical protein
MLQLIGLFRPLEQSHPDPFSAAYITIIAESDFRHPQEFPHSTIPIS